MGGEVTPEFLRRGVGREGASTGKKDQFADHLTTN